MSKLLRILLVLGMIMGGFTIAVSADPIPNADFPIDFSINDGNPADMHDENGWLVAGSGITSTIRVSYTGSESPVIHYVAFTSFEKDTYGDVSNSHVTISPFETVFSASKNTAGNAPIGVHINYTKDGVGYDFYRNVSQDIDHNVPYKTQSPNFESEVSINGTTEITLKMEDKYGNLVDSRYEDDPAVSGATPEIVTFSTTSTAGSGFFDGIGYSAELLSVKVNSEGSAIAKFKVGTEAGPKYLIHMVPPSPLSDKWLTITAIGDAKPYAIAVSVVPDDGVTPHVPADGESKFYLTYTLFDQYGNPSGNQSLHLKDSVIGSESTQRTNSEGVVYFAFGPSNRAELFNISAYAVENESVKMYQDLLFTSTAPVDMLLTANPEFMPSADLSPEIYANLLAKVIDESGNGVPDETVQFLINPRSYDDEVHATDPFLDGNKGTVLKSATTCANGTAIMKFTPGGLKQNKDGEHNIISAFENCTVEATWTSAEGDIKKRTILLTWMNYPYLRVETEVNPELVNVGDSVDVTVRLIGDGYALRPDPIDVMLCVDRSGSMDFDDPPRIVSLKNAMKIFNGEMTEGTDRVGMVSFGGKGKHGYSNYVKKDLSLGPLDHGNLNTAIDSLVPYSGTPLRGGLYEAITEIKDNPNDNADAVKAVILLTDGDFNWYGDPLAGGVAKGKWEYGYNRDDGYWFLGFIWVPDLVWVPYDVPVWVSDSPNTFDDLDPRYYAFNTSDPTHPEENLSVYAINNDITIYTIAFGSLWSPSNEDGISPTAISTLGTLANSTRGKYYYAPDGIELAEIYTKIAGELKTEAGVNTTMDLMFTDIEVTSEFPDYDPDAPILEYVYLDNKSTKITSWNATGSKSAPNIRDQTEDQTSDWNDGSPSLNFDTTLIGTIHLHQTWQAVFRLKVLKEGNINIFGNGSMLYFDDGAEEMTLPKTYITAAPLNSTGINFTGLEVSNLICVEAKNNYTITDYLTMEWNLTYSSSENTTTQYLYYQKESDGIWNKFGEKSPVSGPVSESLQTDRLYVADFPPGYYKLRVRAMADDAPDSVVETVGGYIMIGSGTQAYIKLE